jgi:hypothetical protein
MDAPQLLRVTIDERSRLLCVFGRNGGEQRPVVLLLGPGGAVTLCRGLERPTNCLLTTLPSNLARHGRVLVAVLGVLVPLAKAFASACEGGGECWMEGWATALQGLLAATGCLDWLPDSAATCSAWSRSVAMGACPVVPHQPLLAPSGSGAARAEAAAWAPGSPASRAAVLPVLVWTPEHLSVLVPGGGVQGWAWRVMPGPDAGSLRVYQWLWEGGIFTYSRLRRGDATSLPPALAVASLAARLAVGEEGGAEVLVWRLLAAGGHMDATAASPLALHCAAASAPEGVRAVVADTAERIEALLGPGPHAFATAAVPALTAGGALASAARTAACIGSRSQLVVAAVMVSSATDTQRLLSDSLSSWSPGVRESSNRWKGAAHVHAVGGPPGDASFAEGEEEGEGGGPAPLASMDDESFRRAAASACAARALRSNARVLAELSRSLDS